MIQLTFDGKHIQFHNLHELLQEEKLHVCMN